MVMIIAAMIVIVATVAITVIVAVVAIRVAVVIMSAMHTPMNSAVVAIVGLRLVHGQ